MKQRKRCSHRPIPSPASARLQIEMHSCWHLARTEHEYRAKGVLSIHQ